MSRRNRSFLENYNCFFVTTTFRNWIRLLISDEQYEIIVDSIAFCLDKYNCELVAYVLMPNHIHLVLFYKDKVEVSGFMRDLKKYTSVKLRQSLERNDKKILEVLKFSKDGQKFKVWQDRFDAVVIRTNSVLITKVNYIHENPVKKRIVDFADDWKYSSAGFYLKNQNGILPVKHFADIA